MSLEWNSVSGDVMPIAATRVVVKGNTGFARMGKLVLRGSERVWVDDQSLPIWGVTHWAFVDGPDGERLS